MNQPLQSTGFARARNVIFMCRAMCEIDCERIGGKPASAARM